jgi:AraC family transcriptional regulator
LYSRLERWARRRSLPGARRYLGIGHDAPGITPVDRLRYDAALRVAEAFVGGGEIVHQTIEPGLFAVTTHIGPMASLTAAYPEVHVRAASQRGYRLVGLPVIEFYQTTEVDFQRAIHHTDIYVPVERD